MAASIRASRADVTGSRSRLAFTKPCAPPLTAILIQPFWSALPLVVTGCPLRRVATMLSPRSAFDLTLSSSARTCLIAIWPLLLMAMVAGQQGRQNPGIYASGCYASASAARMGLAIAFQQSVGIDSGMDLGGGKAGMAQQFLNGAQVATLAQQMGRKGMAQRMGCRRGRQAECAAQLHDAHLYQPGRQHAAAHAAKQRLIRPGLEWA